ncbi:STAS domain-containing protein [Myxococcus sp. RHSTA-1-4]|uniref:STAS domain-containing protein n=1 Tax=Myxococcus sp. RHSTA-1-4 TaxID=2874601 RepID=UPI001CBE5282|nr:STAS domain-containing protein [Myxococcus sp. RHSTA-1-4]
MRGQIPILRIGSTLLASIQVELKDTTAQALQADMLSVLEKEGARGLVLDITGLDTVDTFVARVLTDTGRMARLMGTHTVLVGMRPEVAATLARMGFSMQGVHTALNVEEGLALLARLVGARPMPT